MKLIKFIYADDANISGLPNPAANFTNSPGAKITDLLNPRGSGFDVISFVFIIVGILFFFNLILAGWDYMLSSGDPKKAAVANTRLTNGLTGLIMAFTAYLVVKIITTILGIGALV